METKRIDSVRIQTGVRVAEIPWETSQKLRGRLLAAGLESLEDEFAARGRARRLSSTGPTRSRSWQSCSPGSRTSVSRKPSCLVAYSLSGTRFRADLSAPPDPPVSGGHGRS